jgi:hypothetical protein
MDTFDKVISKILNVDHWMSWISNWIHKHVYRWVIMMLWLSWLYMAPWHRHTHTHTHTYMVCPLFFLWLWICPTTWPMAREHNFQGSYKDNFIFLSLFPYFANIYNIVIHWTKGFKMVMWYAHYIPLTCLQDLRFMSSQLVNWWNRCVLTF